MTTAHSTLWTLKCFHRYQKKKIMTWAHFVPCSLQPFFFIIKPDITDTQEKPDSLREQLHLHLFLSVFHVIGRVTASSEQNNLMSPVICCFNSE